MKLSSLWKTLNRDQRRAWNAWAKSNPVRLDDGQVRRVSGHKAMTMVVRNRAVAGESANSSQVPSAATWLDGALGARDAGPFTENAGYVGLRADQAISSGTKWLVWATPPLGETEPNPARHLRFITTLTPPALAYDDVVFFTNQYGAVHGSWDGPGVDGEWPTPTYVWFRVHQYVGGQLSPGVFVRGLIVPQL